MDNEVDTAAPEASWPTIRAGSVGPPPEWAVWERWLIDAMNEAATAFVSRYTRPDGTLIWRDAWPGMDGSDDAYESFHTLPLLYLLGGSEDVHRLARFEWDAITWQFTEYGQVLREFDAYYDWMHHGESYTYLYFLGLADPYILKDRQRADRFAAMYIGEDDEAPNWDAEHRMIRSPINGSRGPRLSFTREDWSTHRDVLRHYPPPFEDIPGVDGPTAEWRDDELYGRILDLMNRRMASGDVPLNLTATSQVTHAYLYTGEAKHRRWVLDYLAAWKERTSANGGIMPDNVGPTGRIGECLDGKWWGGYYGWRWPHGALNLLEASTIAGMNAALLTGDLGHLDLARSQHDLLWSLRREDGGQLQVPHKHLDSGWAAYRPMSPTLPIQLWSLSEAEDDLERVERLPDRGTWDAELATRGPSGSHGAAWYRYIRGEFREYPVEGLKATYAEVCRQMDRIRQDDSDPRAVDVHHWQDRNPVLCAALVELTTGAPYPIYHGGLLHCRVRYFDPEQRRAGLPPDVAALVDAIAPGGFHLRLVNLSPVATRRVVCQGGAFAEHEFVSVRSDGTGAETPVGSPWLEVVLAPGVEAALDLRVRRYARTPSYDTPWGAGDRDVRPIRLRTPDVDPGVVRLYPDEE